MKRTLLLSILIFCSFCIPPPLFAQNFQRALDGSTLSSVNVKTISLRLSGIETEEDLMLILECFDKRPEIHSYELKAAKCQILIDESSGNLYESIIAELESAGIGLELLKVRHNQTFTLTRVDDHSTGRDIKESEAKKQP